MDLEGIMLSEISQRKTNTILSQLYTESKKRTNITKQSQIREQTGGCQSGMKR